MEKFDTHHGLVAPLDRSNVDTDAIIPKQFLRSIRRSGFGDNLFDEWRFLDRTEPGMAPRARRPNPEFVLNQPRYQGASILLCRDNFGCGSSREHAPWALQQYGFRVLLAPGFADIFLGNCYKTGLLPVVLPPQRMDALFQQAQGDTPLYLSVDLAAQTVSAPDGRDTFEISAQRKSSLLHGLDDIALTLQHLAEIEQFEARHSPGWPVPPG